jgi:LPXTG-motif cell wall-anchored protein
MNTTLGLIVGFGLVCGGALLLVRRRDEALDRALAEQASALVALTSR